MVVVTHYRKVGDLKQYTFIPLKFWRSEARCEPYRAKVSMSVVQFLPEALQEAPSLVFSVLQRSHSFQGL